MSTSTSRSVTVRGHRGPKHNAGLKVLLGSLLVLGFLFLSAGDGVAGVRVAVVSDLNGSYGSTRYRADVDAAIDRLIELAPDVVLSTGDMVAGQRLDPLMVRSEVEPMWQSFHGHVTDRLIEAGLQLAVTPGNHDGSGYARFELERRIFQEQWRDRKPKLDFIDDSNYPFYYAFAVDNVLFISLDATVPGSLDDAQISWLDNLLNAEGDRFRHKIAFSHLPLWPFSRNRETEALFDPVLEGVLQSHSVDIYLSGHHHAYYPGYKDGIHFVSQACLGAGPRFLLGTEERSHRAITLLEFQDSGDVQISALAAPEFQSVIPLHSLPEKIVSEHAVLIRMDLIEQQISRLSSSALRSEIPDDEICTTCPAE